MKIIEFKENKTPSLSNTVVKKSDLLRTNQTSYSNSIPQKSDLSTGSEKKTVTRTNSKKMQVADKRDLAPKKPSPSTNADTSPKGRGNESADKGDAAYERAKGQMYKREADEARKQTAEARRDAMSLAQQIARDAYETDAKTFTQKEIDALIGRINQYSTDEFKDIMDEKKATISKIDKEQFAYDIYVAFHLASADKRVMDRMNVLADRLAGNKKALTGFLYYFVNSSVILFSTLGAPSGTSYPTSAGAAQ